MSRRRRTAVATLAVAVALWVVPMAAARADVYGYVDDGGTLHLATEKLDDHYALFLKAGDGRGAAKLVQAGGAPGVATDPAQDAAPDAALTKTRLFQRLVDHPNIARFEALIRTTAARHGLDPQLVKAVIAVESGFDPSAVSDKGAVGLMQVLPATGERYGVRADRRGTVDAKLADPVVNLEIGTRYLSDLQKLFAGRPELALAAYNAGENSVIRFRNAIPPFPETVAYVKLVDQFHTFYDPKRFAKVAGPAQSEADRIRVMIPARRNLPDPNAPLRLPAPAIDRDPSSTVASPVVVDVALRPGDAVHDPRAPSSE